MIKERLNDYLTIEELYEVFEEMKEIMTAKELLQSLAQALSSGDLQENLAYIARCWDL